MSIVRVADAAAAAEAAAERFVAIGRSVQAHRQRSLLAVLAGGSTPRRAYELLAHEPRPRLDWSRVDLFWGDERAVPPDHPASNYRMANEAMLERLGIPHERVHRIAGEADDPSDAARSYEREIARVTAVPRAATRQPPAFDVVLLGMGTDGHTASLFPHSVALDEQTRWVVATCAPTAPRDRITMTLPLLNAARNVLFLVTGAAKAPALAAVLEGPDQAQRLPAQRVRPTAGEVVWIVDDEAAAQLSSSI